MKILYVAYSCLPDKGSEEKIGWNIPIESANTNQVIVVTKEEHRNVIEKYTEEHNISNPKFYFVDIPHLHKKIWKGVAYSIRLNIWHKKAFNVVKHICEDEGVDIIHQITPIEFRSIGKYYRIPNTQFVCGPLGGGEYIPTGLRKYAVSNLHIECTRRVLNCFCKAKYFVNRQLSKCDYLLFANCETQNYMRNLIGNVKSEVYFDNGVSKSEIEETERNSKRKGDKIVFLTAGRMAYRKGHRLLLDAIKRLPQNVNCEFRFVGDGPEAEKLKKICREYKLEERVVFTGKISYSEMKDEYIRADVFIMPSIRETTGAVLLEATSNGVPVIAINRFGAPVLFDNNSAYFFNGTSLDEYINCLTNAIQDCISSPLKICIKAENAKKTVCSQTWKNKMIRYNAIYREVLKR